MQRLRRYPFWMAKLILLKITFIVLGDTTLLCMSLFILCKRSIVYGARKSKVSNTNGMEVC